MTEQEIRASNRERSRLFRERHKGEQRYLEKQRQYYQAHKEEKAAYAKAYREAHKEEIAHRKHRYYLEHKEEIKAKKREYYQKCKEAKNEV